MKPNTVTNRQATTHTAQKLNSLLPLSAFYSRFLWVFPELGSITMKHAPTQLPLGKHTPPTQAQWQHHHSLQCRSAPAYDDDAVVVGAGAGSNGGTTIPAGVAQAVSVTVLVSWTEVDFWQGYIERVSEISGFERVVSGPHHSQRARKGDLGSDLPLRSPSAESPTHIRRIPPR